jgi:hypothetical protein
VRRARLFLADRRARREDGTAMTASVGILNVGAGDTKLSFDPSNPQDCIRAARIVKDMLRRGFALLVDSGKRDGSGRPVYVRALDFDETKHEYIIADFDPIAAQEADDGDAEQAAETSDPAPAAERPRRGRTKRVKASSVSAVAVPRTAGG